VPAWDHQEQTAGKEQQGAAEQPENNLYGQSKHRGDMLTAESWLQAVQMGMGMAFEM
jgi:hypothetical protein